MHDGSNMLFQLTVNVVILSGNNTLTVIILAWMNYMNILTTGNLGVAVLMQVSIKDGITDLVTNLIWNTQIDANVSYTSRKTVLATSVHLARFSLHATGYATSTIELNIYHGKWRWQHPHTKKNKKLSHYQTLTETD